MGGQTMYKIVGDSCSDFTAEELKKEKIQMIPLTLMVGQHTVTDDATFDQKDFLDKVKNTPDCPKSACPAPEAYMEAYKGADDIYVVTLSSQLSGSNNSAELAKNLYIEEYGEKNIHVFDSKGAAATQLLMCRMIEELAEKGESFESIVAQVEAYRDEQNTYFVLETLDFLRKNGRLSKVQAILAEVLSIKPVMAADDNGEIIKKAQVRGIKKALINLIDTVVKEGTDLSSKNLIISYCNCYDRAVMVKEELLKRSKFKSIDIVATRGISTLYAGDGGIIISV